MVDIANVVITSLHLARNDNTGIAKASKMEICRKSVSDKRQ